MRVPWESDQRLVEISQVEKKERVLQADGITQHNCRACRKQGILKALKGSQWLERGKSEV